MTSSFQQSGSHVSLGADRTPAATSPAAAVVRTQTDLAGLDPQSPEYATDFVAALLSGARQCQVSDIHLQPVAEGLDIRWRIDGVLQTLGQFATSGTTHPVTRLKVLADLLTYRHELPQEGRIRDGYEGTEIRVSTFPTLYGERAVVRLFAVDQTHRYLDDLSYPDEIHQRLQRLVTATHGAILITGPAGSGKTTTAYACLRQIVRDGRGQRSVLTLEDPIEVAVTGVSQSQANTAAGFTLSVGLRSLLRQDPEVILVGEVRDQETAGIALQASLTGQLVISTFHASTAAAALNRLSDMGAEPYMLRSGILGILAQRLVRRLCDCKRPVSDQAELLGLDVDQAARAVGCSRCAHTGYRGRIPLAELLTLVDDSQLARAILTGPSTPEIARLAVDGGMVTLQQRAIAAVNEQWTSPAEVRRVLGFTAPERPRP